MKIAFINRNPFTHAGGDVIMLNCLMNALRAIGVDCTNIYGEWGPQDLYPYDLVLIYHMNFTWSRDNFTKVNASLKPYVILPIFYPTDQLGMNFNTMRWALREARMVCPLSFMEAREISQLTGYSGPFTVIPHGTEERFSWHQPMIERQYVMAANARGDKGEKHVERVCARLGLPFRYVTGEPHEKLHLLYRQAKIFVHSSLDDRMSLTVGEALCSGCRVISSNRDRGNEHFAGLKAVNPENETELEAWVKMAWEAESWDYTPNEKARTMTWVKAARAWMEVFKRALA